MNWMSCKEISACFISLALLIQHPCPSRAASTPPSYKYYRIESGAASALAINCRGEIAGDVAYRGFPAGSGDQPFFYSKGTLTALPSQFAVAGITEDGTVVGTDYSAPEWGLATWFAGNFQNPGSPPFTEIWGVSPAPAFVGTTAGVYAAVPYYYDENGSTTMPAPGNAVEGSQGWLFGGNRDGVMVGQGRQFGSEQEGPIVWRGGVYDYLPYYVPGVVTALEGAAFAVNDVETIVGYVGDGPPFGGSRLEPDYAVAWINGASMALSLTADSYAYDISAAGASPWDYYNTGIAVGESNGAAMMWCSPCPDPSCGPNQYPWVEYNLNSLLVNEGYVEPLVAAYGINDCGMIVGESLTGSFLLVPADNTDTDRDGLLDRWEICGIDGDDDGFIDLRLPDADPNIRDLYLELDAMAGHVPPQQALVSIVNQFANNGIFLHILGGIDPTTDSPACETCIDESDISEEDFSDSGERMLAIRCGKFGSSLEQGLGEGEKTARLRAKSKAFRYGLIANIFSDGPLKGVSGYADTIPGTAFVVTLGGLNPPATEDEYAGTIMHEFGHTLGLYHGGHQSDITTTDRYNYKPNYPSVMNYTWQMPVRLDQNIPSIGQLALANWRNSWRLEYSHGLLPSLDENALTQPDNLGLAEIRYVPAGINNPSVFVFGSQLVEMFSDIDWDPSVPGTSTTNVNYILGKSNPAGGTQFDVLEDHDDWAALKLYPGENEQWWDYYPFPDGCSKSGQGFDLGYPEMKVDDYLALGNLRFDCNGNGVNDDEEIESGELSDSNLNGIPDVCEDIGATNTPTPELRGIRLLVSPNPFNPKTTVTFAANANVYTRVQVLDLRGRQVVTLYEGHTNGETMSIDWNAATEPSGVYFVRVESGQDVVTEKVALLK